MVWVAYMVGMGRDSGGGRKGGGGKEYGHGLSVWTLSMEREGRGGGRDRQGVEGYCWGLIHYLTASTSSLFIIDIISVQIMKKND